MFIPGGPAATSCGPSQHIMGMWVVLIAIMPSWANTSGNARRSVATNSRRHKAAAVGTPAARAAALGRVVPDMMGTMTGFAARGNPQQAQSGYAGRLNKTG